MPENEAWSVAGTVPRSLAINAGSVRSTHPSINASVHQRTRPSTHPRTRPPIHPSITAPTHPSINAPVQQRTRPSTHPRTRLRTHPSINAPVHQREVTRHELLRVRQEPVLLELPIEVTAHVQVTSAPRGVQGTPLSLDEHKVPGVVGFAAGRVDVFGVMAVSLGDALNQNTRNVGQSATIHPMNHHRHHCHRHQQRLPLGTSRNGCYWIRKYYPAVYIDHRIRSVLLYSFVITSWLMCRVTGRARCSPDIMQVGWLAKNSTDTIIHVDCMYCQRTALTQ